MEGDVVKEGAETIALTGMIEGSSGTTTTCTITVEMNMNPWKLKYSQKYKIISAFLDEQAILVDSTAEFIVPSSPGRVEYIEDVALNGMKTAVSVTVKGVHFPHSLTSMTVQRGGMEIVSTSIERLSDSLLIIVFGAGKEETASHVEFGEVYEISKVSGESEVFVNPGVFFIVPFAGYVTSTSTELFPGTNTFRVIVHGQHFSPGSEWILKLTGRDDEIIVTMMTETMGESLSVKAGGVDEIQLGQTYTLSTMTLRWDESEHVVCAGVSLETPLDPTLTSIKAELNPTNMSEVVVTLTVDSIEAGAFTLEVVDSSDSKLKAIKIGPFSFSSSSTPTSSSLAVVIHPDGLLSYAKMYIVIRLYSSTLIVAHHGPSVIIPHPPTTIESAYCRIHTDLTTFNLELGGTSLPVGMRWTATLSTGYTISGSFTSDTMGTSETQTFEEDGVYFGMLYTVANVSLENGTVIKTHAVNFTTPGTSELLSVEASMDITKTKLILALTGRDLPSGTCELTLICEDNNEVQTFTFVSESDPPSAVFSMADEPLLEYGKEYRIVNMTASSQKVIISTPLSFTIPAAPSLVGISVGTESGNNLPVTLQGEEMPDGDHMVLVMRSGETGEMRCMVRFIANEGQLDLDMIDTFFAREQEYSISSFMLFGGCLVHIADPLKFVIPRAPLGMTIHAITAILLPSKKHITLSFVGSHFPTTGTWTARLSNGLMINGTIGGEEMRSNEIVLGAGGLEPDTEYRVEFVEVGSEHTLAVLLVDTFCTPHVRREGTIETLYAILTADGQSGRIRVGGTGLSPGPIEFSLTSAPTLVHSAVRVSEGLFEVKLPLGPNAGELQCGMEYTVDVLDVDSCDVSWNALKTFTVPPPPKVVSVVAESNEIGTGVILDLMGAGLQMEEDYIVTLLPSGSFVVHFNDSSRASIEICFDGDDFDYSTTYTIDSIVHVGNPDHKMDVSAGATFTTAPKPEQVVFYVSSVRGERNELCGEESRPCASVDCAWGIVEPLSINSVSIAILDESELATPIEQTAGSLSIFSVRQDGFDTLVVRSTASLGEREAMIVIRGSFEMRQVEVLIEVLSSKFVFLSAVNAAVTLKEGSVVGMRSPSTMNADDTSQLCRWESGMIQLLNSSSFVSGMSFHHLFFGAFVVHAGDVVIEASRFSSNSPNFASFPSACRNVACSSDGTVDVRSLTGGDGTEENISAWIESSECTLSSSVINLDSPFFVPIPLTDHSTSRWDKDTDTFHVEIHGKTLIPCGLFLELVGQSESGEPMSTQIELLPSIATLFNESFISLDLPSSVVSDVASAKDVRARLVYGNSVATEELFALAVRNASSGLGTLAWLIPVIVGVVVFLTLVVLIVVCVVCRRRKKEKEKLEEEEEPVEQQEETEEKSDQTSLKTIDEPTLSDPLPDLILAPEETDQFDLKNDEADQERPHPMKHMEEHILTDTHPNLILPPDETDQYNLKDDEADQE
ncbi:hypothetical protein BLNAU_17598 [Blattamonas nauphoetae]|uniref:Uncharacterized protein n=1 Tax=Blattamonas nauphoetae TaxID=2049346 RepID=A0ABQ9X763_9EUKA|nr:hypothetical protein BLNAU_17598 [Blattamonas nauphoetae]